MSSSCRIIIILFLINFVFCNVSFISCGICIPGEREALLQFKNELTDPSNRLASWIDDTDCCRWSGVVCHNVTGHVVELHVTSLSEDEYYTTYDDAAAAPPPYREFAEKSVFGGKINPSLLYLKHLKYLDLSYNNFGGIPIPKFLGSMTSLRYLNLSGAGFGGMVPHQLGNLSNLQYLNLKGDDYFYHPKYVESLYWLSSLRSLEFIDLSSVNLSKAYDWLRVLNTLPSLVELHLSGCDLYPIDHHLPLVNFSSLAKLDLRTAFQPREGVVPRWIFGIKTLTFLDLARNYFLGPIPLHIQNLTSLIQLDLSHNQFNSSLPDWLDGVSQLEFLYLQFNMLEGRIPSSLGNLTSLDTIYLSYNNGLKGGIPASFKNLCNLRSLDLSFLQMFQDINEVLEILSECPFLRLESLFLFSCRLSGHLTNHLVELKNLVSLDLNGNSIFGHIPESLGELNSLHYLNLGNNYLNGTLPDSFGMLENLERIDLSRNALEGKVYETHFTKLKNLKSFRASGNHLVFRVTPDWVPPFQHIEELYLVSCHVGPLFPAWLRPLNHLNSLDLSNSKISSTLPIWFLNMSLSAVVINLSHNQMHGNIPYINLSSSSAIESQGSYIDLSSNHFEGPLPQVSSNLTQLNLSNNSFTGSISNFLCGNMHEVNAMAFLNLGKNHLSGELPNCWENWKNLRFLKLSDNNFSGKFPPSFGMLTEIEFLDIHNNNMSGEIPLSLQSWNYLYVLDLRGNGLRGDISTWTTGEQLPQLVILNLRENKFHGKISEKLCHMTSLQILDLADNNLSGAIPECISNLTAMETGEGSGQWTTGWITGSVSVITSSAITSKGRRLEYDSILIYVRSLDLSNNKLTGEIPEEITSLVQLQSLNLSNNLLSGRIPKDMGAMQSLQSLDFSQNLLIGEIPQSMASLSKLSRLNLSYNKLSGRIPVSTQLGSLEASSFIGNNLSGPPLTKDPRDAHTVQIDKESRTADEEAGVVDWFYVYVSIAPGFVVGFWVVVGPLAFNRQWRDLYFAHLNRLWNKILECCNCML
ncbi:receptor-like protein EIX2 [Mercurialis annua]|uniref:receptor-like protein EIX2 n=1 Tax=Mercurialis annua TaxID=3986 RepID=UPI002161034A|nr:receptor-like protein EIX2 [Mercurialis annua]